MLFRSRGTGPRHAHGQSHERDLSRQGPSLGDGSSGRALKCHRSEPRLSRLLQLSVLADSSGIDSAASSDKVIETDRGRPLQGVQQQEAHENWRIKVEKECASLNVLSNRQRLRESKSHECVEDIERKAESE